MIHPADPLRPDGPFIPYIALHKGEPGPTVPEFPLDDEQPDGDGKFELSADDRDGRQLLPLRPLRDGEVRALLHDGALPLMRRTEDGVWLEAETGKPLKPVRVAVDKSQRCG